MDNEFLHSINLDLLQSETGLDVHGIANAVGVDPQSVYRWSWPKEKNGNRPKFNAVKILLERGASVKTLFGVDSAEISVPENLSDFDDKVKESILRLLSKNQ